MTVERGASPGASGERSELRVHLGRTLREARQEAGLTQAAFAALAGLTQQYVAKIEAGQINPTLATMATVARVLDLDVGDMLHPAGLPAE